MINRIWWGRQRYWRGQWADNRQVWEWTSFAELNDYILFGWPAQTDDDGNAVKIKELK